MGEYYTDPTTGEQYKLGTCETLYYVRRDEIKDIPELRDYLRPTVFFYRFPWPDEDGQDLSHSHSRDYEKTNSVNVPELGDIPHSVRCTRPRFCPDCANDPAMDARDIGNPVRIVAEKYDHEGRPYTVFACGYCDQWFSCDEEEAEMIRAGFLRHVETLHNCGQCDEALTVWKIADRIRGRKPLPVAVNN